MVGSVVRQAVILAGGQATRMRPYTEDAPKAMVPVAGAPIIAYQLLWLAEHGVTHVVVSCGYKSGVIRDYVGDGAVFGLEATYAEEPTPLGRGGGLKYSCRWLPWPTQRFCVLNGDIVTRFVLGELASHHEHHGGAVTLALAPYRSNWGVVDVDDHDTVHGFTQSPVLPYWINAGAYVFEPEVIGALPERGDHEDSTFPELARAGRLIGYRLRDYWWGVDTVKDVQLATADMYEHGYVVPSRFQVPAVG